MECNLVLCSYCSLLPLAAMIEEFERREALLRSELDVTKQSYESM